MGLTVVERSIDRTELYLADEAFFTGTGVQIAAITRVDHRLIGTGRIGPLTSLLRERYFDVVRGNDPAYRTWCRPVYATRRKDAPILLQESDASAAMTMGVVAPS
jgi:branched-chain amino acid aminotransferase